ncbi:hypothetical protein B0T22DRAFT_287224 [Podospora appendiculata]|uniref:Uncharacterized protein n=1 Tax=Podospora appendiculata TaxID=314037 RepID=A0AAE0X187_9PEZI|nr:hypothetical protein B0T22DRAFT_287224 [Podospora appendiculata]
MAVLGATQALIAAFNFGIVVNAASAALFLYTKGHGSSIFRDGPRLVLVLFLISAALWAQIDFIAVLLDVATSPMPCQIGVIFATIFDQLGRFSIEQYILWDMNGMSGNNAKVSAWQMIPQLLILGRFVAGAVFSGFTRPQTDTFCVAKSSALPVSIMVIALDAVILLLLTAKALSTGLIANMKHKGSSAARSKSLVLVMLGLAIWTATSVTLMLGMENIALVPRTALPAGGLTILLLIVTACAGTLATPRGTQSSPPEAPSPRRMNISRDISTSDSDYPPTRYEDLKEAAIRSSTTFINPREAPRLKDETSVGLPTISRPITGVTGVGGVAIQGQLFPPLRTGTAVEEGRARKIERSGSQKRRMFDFGKGAAVPAGRPVIGNPILQDNDAQNPLNKIVVMDLRDAVKAERERRARAQGESDAVINRPVPQPSSVSPEEALKRSVSVKRKEIASVSLQPDTYLFTLQPETLASTTSAQLSPAGDEVRRRSPRQPSQDQAAALAQLVEASGMPRPESLHPQQAAHAMSTVPQQPVPNLEIRPSRQLPPSPKPSSPEPTKTPLQRRPTIGLPSNPKARGLKVTQQAGSQTVLFVNRIVYDNPDAVQNIIDGANVRASKAAPVPDPPGSARSVVNRPRPIPRKVADPNPQAIPLMMHRRSKSGGSFSRKSIFTSTAGSPTQLPPLPPPPKSAGGMARPHPNDTKSMTFNEKMTLLFPSPASGNAIKRRSSVPELPRIPASYVDLTSPAEANGYPRSNRTTRTSIQTGSIFDVDELPQRLAQEANQLSHDTYPNISDEVGSSWMPSISTGKTSNKGHTSQSSTGAGGKRASSPVLPIRSSAWTESTGSRTHDDTTTNWGSEHSPELAVGMPVTRKAAQSTIIPKVGRLASVAANNRTRLLGDDNSRELRTATGQQSSVQDPQTLDDETALANERASSGKWHRRVGDDCLTFSGRKAKARSRKMPPPTPLLLNAIAITSKNTIIVQAEPSPLESPEHALREIQAQLQKLEEPDADYPNSQTQRIALLENLEKEMGLQEDHWQEMKHDLGRDSLSSIQTMSPVKRSSRGDSMASIANIAHESSLRLSIGADRRASRRSLLRNGGVAKPIRTSARNPEQMTGWQQHLTVESMDAATGLVRKRGSNLVRLSMAQLGSPTPPNSGQSDQSDEDGPYPARQSSVAIVRPSARSPQRASLWTPTPYPSIAPTSLLWAHVPRASPMADVPLPGLSVRPASRKGFAPLHMQSSQLWRKPHSKIRRTDGGLWRPAWASAAPPADHIRSSSQSPSQLSQRAPRPLTQRPPRRNKRVTLLPDILESPKPLPDKRGTLGIFQFPWGERSDTAAVQSRSTVFMAMPGTMTTGGPSNGGSLEARARQLESAEYSSSFFDDYDDEDDTDAQNSDFEDGDDSDDGFDETTLWEIASLLKSDAVPSKNSMFPPSSRSVEQDYMDELPSDDEGGPSKEQSIMIGLAEETRELFFDQRPHEKSTVFESTTLWTLENEAVAEDPLPIQDVRPAQSKTSRIPRAVQVTVEPVALEAQEQASKPSQIPRPAGDIMKARESRKQLPGGLWEPPVLSESSNSNGGLFVLDSTRTDYRTTAQEPAAVMMDRKHRRTTPKPLKELTSTSLWTSEIMTKQGDKHWTGKKPKTLWDAPVLPKRSSLKGGLFALDSSRTNYRTTAEEPAALRMTRKPRSSKRMSLERVASRSLWTAASVSEKGEHHWTAKKSKTLWRPRASLKQRASVNGLFMLDSSRPITRTTTQEPATLRMDRKPRPIKPQPLTQLTSTNLWTHETIAKPSEHHWTGHKPTGGRHHHHHAVSPADWGEALRAAINASYPQKRFKRIDATPAEWRAALEEALVASRWAAMPSTKSFDAAACHPVFAASSLVTRSEWFHPAATGYTFDVANVHPVFFGSLAITCPEEAVHPAMSAYAAKKLRRQRSKHHCSLSRSSSGRSLSRSGSNRSLRKEEILAQIRALEEESTLATSPVPQVPAVAEIEQDVFSMYHPAIQAQIEALEQEKMFAQQVAQQDYRRRTLQIVLDEPLVEEPEPVPAERHWHNPAMGVRTMEDLQRHLESQAEIRQSLMWTSPPSPMAASPAAVQAPAWFSSAVEQTSGESTSLLWSSAAKSALVSVDSNGMWTPAVRRPNSSSTPSLVTAMGEDGEAAERLARGRRSKQKKQRHAEILAKIAAIEAGVDGEVEYQRQGMWVRGAHKRLVKGGGKEWLRVNENRQMGRVMLRY